MANEVILRSTRSFRNSAMQCSSIAGLVLFSILAPVRVHAQTTADTSRAGAASSTPAVPATPSTTVKVGGYVQLRETAQERVGLTGTLNRARISADVGLPNGFSARVMIETAAAGTPTAASTVSLRDAYIRWTRRTLALTFGQYKSPM